LPKNQEEASFSHSVSARLNLIAIIHYAIWDIRRPITPEWIKGHQDHLCPYSRLPFWAKLNVDADFLAARYRDNGRLKPSQNTDHHDRQQVSLSIQGVRITSHIDSCIRFHINGYHLRQYLQEKRKWSDSTWDSVDFESFGRHFQRLSPPHQIAHMKFVHDQQPLGVRWYRIAPAKTESLKLCPCCLANEEDQRHFLTCPSNSGRDNALLTFKKSMLVSDYHPIRYLIEGGIRNWITNPSQQYQPNIIQFPSYLHDTLHLALISQDMIGWDNAVKGFLGRYWREAAGFSMS
jgi:hypothetical protein